MNLLDEELELLDPTPDIQALFLHYNVSFFDDLLGACEVKWSPKMTLCAGICSYQPLSGFCSIRLSKPLLSLRPRSDLVNTLLHEMIHAFLFITRNNRDREDHGPEFMKHTNRINSSAGTNITVFHSFSGEVDSFRTHWWKCDGPCVQRAPHFGIVKRAMNRPPQPADDWWALHQSTCGGNFVKIREPDARTKKATRNGDKASAIVHDGSTRTLESFWDVSQHKKVHDAVINTGASSSVHQNNIFSNVGKFNPKLDEGSDQALLPRSSTISWLPRRGECESKRKQPEPGPVCVAVDLVSPKQRLSEASQGTLGVLRLPGTVTASAGVAQWRPQEGAASRSSSSVMPIQMPVRLSMTNNQRSYRPALIDLSSDSDLQSRLEFKINPELVLDHDDDAGDAVIDADDNDDKSCLTVPKRSSSGGSFFRARDRHDPVSHPDGGTSGFTAAATTISQVNDESLPHRSQRRPGYNNYAPTSSGTAILSLNSDQNCSTQTGLWLDTPSCVAASVAGSVSELGASARYTNPGESVSVGHDQVAPRRADQKDNSDICRHTALVETKKQSMAQFIRQQELLFALYQNQRPRQDIAANDTASTISP